MSLIDDLTRQIESTERNIAYWQGLTSDYAAGRLQEEQEALAETTKALQEAESLADCEECAGDGTLWIDLSCGCCSDRIVCESCNGQGKVLTS